jgi:hypothetical protein
MVFSIYLMEVCEMRKFVLASLLALGLGVNAQAQYVYPAPLVPVYPAPVVAYPAPLFPVVPVTPLVPVAPAVPVAPVYPVVAPNCAWVSVPVSSWQWVQGIFGGWRLRWVTTFQNQLVCN